MLPPENGLPARLMIELVKSTHKAFLAQSKAPPPLEPEKPAQNAAQKESPETRGLSSSSIQAMEGSTRRARTHHQHARKGGHARFLQSAEGKARGDRKIPCYHDQNHRCVRAAGRPGADGLGANGRPAHLHPCRCARREGLGEKSVQEVAAARSTPCRKRLRTSRRRSGPEREQGRFEAGVGSERALPATVNAEINSILSELESRGKKNRSLALANYLIEHMKDKMKFNIRPHRSANLRVLKAAGVPAVLDRAWIFEQHRG